MSAPHDPDAAARTLYAQHWPPGDDWESLSANARNAWRRAAAEPSGGGSENSSLADLVEDLPPSGPIRPKDEPSLFERGEPE